MIGQIEQYSSDTPTVGVISSDGVSYNFNIKAWRSHVIPKVGDTVDFEIKKGQVTRVKVHIVYPPHLQPVKSRWIAGILGLVLGGLGIHNIYLGFYGKAFLQIAVTLITQGFGLLWGFIEGFLILSSNINKDAKGRDLK